MATRESTPGRDPASTFLAGVTMSPHDRRQAEQDMHTAEQLVDFIFGIVEGTQALVRRLRGTH